MMKLLALILIFAACCLGGYCLAAPYKRRPLLLNQLHSGILGLENRLIYYGEPLHLALVHLGAGHDDAVSCLFYGMGKSMEKDPRLSPRQAAEQELNAPNYASLTAMYREILLEIFEGMGRDQQGQKSALSHGRDQLRDAAASAQEQKEKNAKLYQSMGLLLGAAAVVLLV